MKVAEPLLALDCSTRWCLLALRVQGRSYEYAADVGRSHSQQLLPAIDTLQREASVSALGGIGVVVGPGSFTGVRIAVAAAQALAFAHDCPVARLDALQLQVVGAVSDPACLLPPAPVVCCARKSRGELYYVGAYACHGARSRRLGSLALVGSVAELHAWWAQVSSEQSLGAEAVEALPWVAEAPPWLPIIEPVQTPAPEATLRMLLQLTDQAAAANQLVPAADALPLYLQADSPWRTSRS